MMKLADDIYYQLYKFYKRHGAGGSPERDVLGYFGFAFGFFLFGTVNMLLAVFMPTGMISGLWLFAFVAIGLLLAYLMFGKGKRYKQIIRHKPQISRSKWLSGLVAIGLMVVCLG